MREGQRYERLDKFRILAAVLVVAIHTSPLSCISTDTDFFLTRVLARIAVPFFFMVTGQFVVSDFLQTGAARTFRYVKKMICLYGIAMVIYLPIGIYAKQYEKIQIADIFKMLIFDGTFYHLWYFPACILGVLLVSIMGKFFRGKWLLVASALLYGIGLFGDSYYGLIENVPVVSEFYTWFFHISSYTRNGIFLAPIFLVLGAETGKIRIANKQILWAGLGISFVAMTEEAFLLRHFEVQRHDSMYVLLPAVMLFLYQLLIYEKTTPKSVDVKNYAIINWFDENLTTISTWIYILHPAMIVVVRAMSKALKWDLLVTNSLVHYLAVLAGSFVAAVGMAWLAQKYSRRSKKQMAIGSVSENQSSEDGCGRAWLELDRKALRQNVTSLRSKLPESCKLMPAVKADAYGHGAVLIAKELQKMGIRSFCVASVQEGRALRSKGIKGVILVLGYTHPSQFPLLCKYHLTQTVVVYAYAKQLNSYGEKIHVHIGVDTGMHRIGERCENFDSIAAMYEMENLVVDGLFTHLCASDKENLREQKYTDAQVQAFYQLVARLKEKGYPCPKLHMLASYGVFHYPNLAGDYARVGIALYGVLSTNIKL